MGHKSETEAMSELTSLMWSRYLKEQVRGELNHEMNAYKAEVVTNHGDGTLTVKRPFETVQLRLKAAHSLSYAQAGDMVLVVGIGDKSKALSNAFILCKTDMTDDTDVPVYGMGENLFNNWYFIGGGSQLGAGIFPINQRGQTSYTVAGYGIDRWRCERTTHTLTIQSDCIHWERVTNGSFNPRYYQPVKFRSGEVYTFSILYRTTFRKLRETLTATLLPEASDWTLYTKTATVSVASADIGIQDISYNQGLDDTGKYVEIKAMKLEVGTRQTLAHQENGAWVLNDIPNYEAEMIKCQPFLTTLSRYSAWRATSLSANEIWFYVTVPSTMRSATPTLVNGTNFAVRGWGGSNETGFSFEISRVFKNAIQIKASKTSHGLTDAVLLANTGDVLVSAE